MIILIPKHFQNYTVHSMTKFLFRGEKKFKGKIIKRFVSLGLLLGIKLRHWYRRERYIIGYWSRDCFVCFQVLHNLTIIYLLYYQTCNSAAISCNLSSYEYALNGIEEALIFSVYGQIGDYSQTKIKGRRNKDVGRLNDNKMILRITQGMTS